VNRINPKKLLYSKWTAVAPVNREKHFMITDVEVDEEGQVIGCEIEAVLSRRQMQIDWSELKDDARWLQGWK